MLLPVDMHRGEPRAIPHDEFPTSTRFSRDRVSFARMTYANQPSAPSVQEANTFEPLCYLCVALHVLLLFPYDSFIAFSFPPASSFLRSLSSLVILLLRISFFPGSFIVDR